jgi:hypothetical protein
MPYLLLTTSEAKKPIFRNPRAKPKNSMATKHRVAYPKPKSFSGKFHQTLSYCAQGRAFPLVFYNYDII